MAMICGCPQRRCSLSFMFSIASTILFLSAQNNPSAFSPVLRRVPSSRPQPSLPRKVTTALEPIPIPSSISASSTSLDAAKKEICILGGGFGGLNAALTLASLPFGNDDDEELPTITIVDKKERFAFLPLLYELCVGDAELEEVAPTYKSLLQGTNIQFRQANIQGIDIENDTVYLNKGDKLNYDSLIVATGSDVNLEPIPGASTHALPFYTIEDCFELQKRLTLLDSTLNAAPKSVKEQQTLKVVVVGGGYSGVELALNMKERLKNMGMDDGQAKVTLIHRGAEILEYATEHNRKTGSASLKNAGVVMKTNMSVVDVLSCEDDKKDGGKEDMFADLRGKCRVLVESKGNEGGPNINEMIDADILLWTAGAMSSNAPRGILNSKLPRDSSGRIVTDKFLRVKGTDNVFALGDCSRVKKIPYGATAAVAMQQAPYAAWNVYASEMKKSQDGRSKKDELKLLPFQYIDLGEMMTLGGEDATISSMGLVELNGPVASVLRRLIYAVRMPTVQQALTAAISSSSKRFESLLTRGSKTTETTRSGGLSKSLGSAKKIIDWQ